MENINGNMEIIGDQLEAEVLYDPIEEHEREEWSNATRDNDRYREEDAEFYE